MCFGIISLRIGNTLQIEEIENILTQNKIEYEWSDSSDRNIAYLVLDFSTETEDKFYVKFGFTPNDIYLTNTPYVI
jgi:hypothetical protein